MILKYLKSISNLSLIFLIADFALLIAGYSPAGEYVFIWMIIFSIVLNIDKSLNIYYKTLLIIILVFPVFMIKENFDKLIALIIFSVVFYLHRENSNKFSYEETAEEFKKAFFVIIAILLLSQIYLNKIVSERYIIPYMLLYVVFTVPYLRYLRNYEHNAVNDELNKINIIYVIMIISSSLVFSLKYIRQFVIDIFLFIYKGIMDILIYILSDIFIIIYNFLKKIHFQKNNIFENINVKNQELIKTSEADYAISHPLFVKIIVIIINAALILTALYIIRKVLKKKYNAVSQRDKCEETREFIFYEKRKERKRRRLLIFGDYYSQIKYYYRKLMKDAVSKGVNIKNSDTTMDIYLKSRDTFNEENLWHMRDIYINIRYGNKTCTKDKVEEFHNLYKNRNIRRNI